MDNPKDEKPKDDKPEVLDTTIVATKAVIVPGTPKDTPKSAPSKGDPSFIKYKDTNSAPVTPVDRKQGATAAINEFKTDADGKEIDSTVTPVDRTVGATGAVKEYKTDADGKEIDSTVTPVDRKSGSRDAVKEYKENYRTRIQYQLSELKESFEQKHNLL